MTELWIRLDWTEFCESKKNLVSKSRCQYQDAKVYPRWTDVNVYKISELPTKLQANKKPILKPNVMPNTSSKNTQQQQQPQRQHKNW